LPQSQSLVRRIPVLLPGFLIVGGLRALNFMLAIATEPCGDRPVLHEGIGVLIDAESHRAAEIDVREVREVRANAKVH